ncbi:hypothetical protein quinque_014391 [Culex quinquefasciatus]
MLTATLEHGQEDVNPDDYLELKQQPPQHATEPGRVPFRKSPLAPLRNNQQQQQQQKLGCKRQSAVEPSEQYPLIKLKRRYREKENSEEERPRQEEKSPEPVRRFARTPLQRKLDEDIRLILQDTVRQVEFTKQTRRRRHRLSLAAKAFEKSPSELLVERQRRRVEQNRIRDWDRVEVFREEEEEPQQPEPVVEKPEEVGEERKESEPEVEEESLHRRCVHKKVIIKRKRPAVSSSRLSLSKEFHRRRLIEEQQYLWAKDEEKRKRRKCQLDGSSSSDSFQEEAKEEEQQPEKEKPGARLGDAPGVDQMSIHHQQQQQHHHHYHLPSTTTSSSNFPASSTSSLLLLTSAAVTGGGDSDSDGGLADGGMAGHSHYTRSKASRIQGQMSLESATDMAIAASLNDLPRSKVASLQGRLDTGTATELAIAQSLNENQQNALNSAASAATGSSVIITQQSLPETPASIAAAANANNALATLCNIGNSCYLNSVLYTLRFAPNFIHNLHHLIEDTDSVYQRLSQNKLKSSSLGRNIPGLHGASGRSWSSKDLASLGGSSNNSSSSTLGAATSNGTSNLPPSTHHIREENLPPKTNRQVVTEQLHELFQNLHRNEAIDTAEPYHAGNILRAVQDVSATFEGNQQQDAHEFLMCVLDSIRESCQSLIKTITDHPDVLINTCPPVPECIETFVPEAKSSGARVFFRRRKDPAKTAASKQQSPVNGGATTLPKAGSGGGGGGDAADQLASLKSALLAGGGTKAASAVDDAIVRDRVQALGLDFFRDDFEGVTVAKTKCLECETCTEQKETMIDIAIPITASEVSDAAKNPQLFYQNSCITREYFRGDNKYRCEVCCGYREAMRSISFEVLPRQLILQLKRFNGDMEKINSYIPTPFVLRCFCNTCLLKPDCDKPHIYRLYSVITHVGARMSVGHYIAYTSSLDVHGEYFGCGKDRRKQALLAGGSIDGGSFGAGAGAGGTGSTGSQSGKSSEKSTSGQLKKLFGGKKASSAGDMSKKIKNNNKLNLINGMEGLNLINGAGSALGNSNTASFGSQSGGNSPSSNGTPTSGGNAASLLASRAIPCAGLNCCGIHLKNSHLSLYGPGGPHHHHNHHHHHHHHHSTDSPDSNGIADYAERNGSAAATPAAFEQSLSQQLWHMCDDDKIKIMSQQEFEELLSPNRRHVITPYLLFYARYDLVPSAAAAGKKDEPSSATKGTTVAAATAADVDMAAAD